MIPYLQELIRYRELLITFALRDLKVRYKQTIMGMAWAILQPLALMAIFTIVFSKMARVPSDGIPYPIFSYCALLPWTFFSTSINMATPSVTNNMNLVTKIYFPREVLPIATVMACFVDFLIASVIFVGMMFFYHVGVNIHMLWIPVIVLIQIVFTLGIVLLTSCGNVYFRDVKHIMPIGLQIWMYLTPIIYPVSLVPEKWKTLYTLNPMVGIIDGYRKVILHASPPEFKFLILAGCVSIVLFSLGYFSFKKAEGVFADVI